MVHAWMKDASSGSATKMPKFLTCAHSSVILEAQDFERHGRVRKSLLHLRLGRLQSLDWTSGLDWWTGLVDWTRGLD